MELPRARLCGTASKIKMIKIAENFTRAPLMLVSKEDAWNLESQIIKPSSNPKSRMSRRLGFKSLNRFILGMFVPGRVVMNIQKIFFSEESCLSRARRFKMILTIILYRDFLVSSPSSLTNLIVYFLLGPATRVLCLNSVHA